jgi:nucleoside-diphosphate-sugar epimerase
MKIAITGATGFVGRHLARSLSYGGHELVLIARGADGRDRTVRRIHGAQFYPVPVTDEDGLAQVFAGCDAVAHCAGINRETGEQTYCRVHIEGTQAVVNAARRAGVKKIALMSFLRARPDCGSGYHESKWQAEEIVRNSGLDYTILKASVVYGRGDHLLDHLARSIMTIRLFALVGRSDAPVRPVAVEDVVRLFDASLAGGRLSRQTVAVMGPESLPLSSVVRRVAKAVGRRVYVFPAPVWFHKALAWGLERVMTIPLISLAQVRMLAEGIAEPLPGCVLPPEDLAPRRDFTIGQIRAGLPDLRAFGWDDLRCGSGRMA